MSKKYILGTTKTGNVQVEVDMDKSDNANIIVLGKPGSGKSTLLDNIAYQSACQGNLVVMFDTFSTVDTSSLPYGFREKFQNAISNIDVHKDGFKCRLFSHIKNSYNDEETDDDLCDSLVDMLSAGTQLGYKQCGALRRAIRDVIENGGYTEKTGIKVLADILDDDETPEAMQVKNRLISILDHDVFRDGELDLIPGRINAIRLSAFADDIQVVIAEIILRYLWKLAENNYFKNKGITLFIDEVQNYSSNKDSIVSKILTMGRKFNISIVTATQQLDTSNKNTIQKKVLMSSLRIYFEPDPGQVKVISQCINPKEPNKWTLPLKRLTCGNFVACGESISVKGVPYKQPVTVQLNLK